MNLFRHDSEYSVAWEAKPWWRAMSLNGWLILLFGLFASFAFVLGAFSGEVLFIASPKQKSGPAAISFQDYPVWFCILMLVNFVVALVVLGQFFAWLRRRKG